MLKALLAASLVAALASPALAQSSSPAGAIDAVRRDAPVHAGPFYLAPTVQLKELGIDSNVFNASGDQVSDFTFTLAPQADVYLPFARRILLHGNAGTDLVWYSKYTSERSIDPQLGGRAEIYLRRITLFGEHQYTNSRQRLNYEVDLRSRHVLNMSAGGLEVRLTPKLSVESAFRVHRTDFDADATTFEGTSLQRVLNQKTETLAVTTRERLTPLTTVAVRVDRMRDTFEFSPVRNSHSYRIMPGVEFKPRALVNGSAYVGYRKFTPMEPGALPAFSGLVAQLGLSYTLLGATTFGVTFGRDLTYSWEELQPFFVNQGVGASLRRALGSRFDVLVSADRYRYEYQDVLPASPAVGPPGATRVDVTRNYAGSIGYRVGRAGRVGVGASYWKRESTTRLFRNYDNLRFGTTFSYGL